jgi:hypothetical protein
VGKDFRGAFNGEDCARGLLVDWGGGGAICCCELNIWDRRGILFRKSCFKL